MPVTEPAGSPNASSLEEKDMPVTGKQQVVNAQEKENDDEPDSMLNFTASQPPPKEEPAPKSSLAELFSSASNAEEKSSLTAILERVPDVSIEEILNDLNEIREMLRGRLDED